MIEFTGERVIPGEVEEDLWAEHIARYAFARDCFSSTRALDIGCGAGYGTDELAAPFAIGIDISRDAIWYAREHYPRRHFLEASATALPFPNASFDLITAFEVIEHVSQWRDLLHEARRVLRPNGLFLVSTPNKLYYAESRASNGPNPFHLHEFEFDQFRDALSDVFPGVTILLQNRSEAIVFSPSGPAMVAGEADIEGLAGDPAHAHFFLALCAVSGTPKPRQFAYVPRAANILREREHHIALLEDELATNKRWLASMTADRDKLLDLYSEQKQQLEEHNVWALQLEKDWKAALERITQVQEELKSEQAAANAMASGYAQKVEELQDENRRRADWAMDVEARFSAQLASKCAELAETVRLLDQAEATVVERTRWGQALQAQLEELEAQLQMIRQSRWLKLGRTVGLGPQVKAR
ncbi:MAG TPA: methyltransferase domain-containing protein [Bryobacteraceae bacterium]|nr:methyltransferase domain-containing protein [Bryobacteraceae bacterium]